MAMTSPSTGSALPTRTTRSPVLMGQCDGGVSGMLNAAENVVVRSLGEKRRCRQSDAASDTGYHTATSDSSAPPDRGVDSARPASFRLCFASEVFALGIKLFLGDLPASVSFP